MRLLVWACVLALNAGSRLAARYHVLDPFAPNGLWTEVPGPDPEAHPLLLESGREKSLGAQEQKKEGSETTPRDMLNLLEQTSATRPDAAQPVQAATQPPPSERAHEPEKTAQEVHPKHRPSRSSAHHHLPKVGPRAPDSYSLPLPPRDPSAEKMDLPDLSTLKQQLAGSPPALPSNVASTMSFLQRAREAHHRELSPPSSLSSSPLPPSSPPLPEHAHPHRVRAQPPPRLPRRKKARKRPRIEDQIPPPPPMPPRYVAPAMPQLPSLAAATGAPLPAVYPGMPLVSSVLKAAQHLVPPAASLLQLSSRAEDSSSLADSEALFEGNPQKMFAGTAPWPAEVSPPPDYFLPPEVMI